MSFSKKRKKEEESKWVRKSVNTKESFMEEKGIEWIEVVMGWDPLLVAI